MDIPVSKGYPDTFKAMENLVTLGLTKSIGTYCPGCLGPNADRSKGVSNFNILKLKRLINETSIIPAANQIEINPYLNPDADSGHGLIYKSGISRSQNSWTSARAVTSRS